MSADERYTALLNAIRAHLPAGHDQLVTELDATVGERLVESEDRRPTGERARSTITLVVEVVHDGDPSVLGEHLAIEVDQLLDRWGCGEPSTRVASVVVAEPGDDVSRRLPEVGCGHEARG